MPGTFYPMFGTAAYWQIWNDPFYGPNYANPNNPWFHKQYPEGFQMSGDSFVPIAYSSPVRHHSGVGTFLKVLVAIVVVGLLGWFGWFFYNARRNTAGSYDV